MKSKLFYVQLLGALLLFLLMLIIVPIYAQRIPEALTQRVDERLKQHGFSWVSISSRRTRYHLERDGTYDRVA